MANYSKTYLPQSSAIYRFVPSIHSLKLTQNGWNFFCGTRIEVPDVNVFDHPMYVEDVNFVICEVINSNQGEDTPLLDFIAIAKLLTDITVSNTKINPENHLNFKDLVLVDSVEVLSTNAFFNLSGFSTCKKSIVINCSYFQFKKIMKRIEASLGFGYIESIDITFMTSDRDAITLHSCFN